MLRFHPSDCIRQYKSGRADMDADTAAFGIDEGWCLVAARIHFRGGTGTADCVLSVLNYDEPDDSYDATLYDELTGLGTGTDAHISVEDQGPEMLEAFSFNHRQRLLFSWTNPDPDNMQWGIELLLIPWAKIPRLENARLA